jgi:hypothetical protein
VTAVLALDAPAAGGAVCAGEVLVVLAGVASVAAAEEPSVAVLADDGRAQVVLVDLGSVSPHAGGGEELLDMAEGVLVDEGLVAASDAASVVLDDPDVVGVPEHVVKTVRSEDAFGEAFASAAAEPLPCEMVGEVA